MDNLRKIQMCELDILNEIARICDKYQIGYWLAYGTMLGAVRHKGFIPWDDDLDIYMTYEGFKKFSQVCKTELKAEYFLQTPDSDPLMPWLFYKVRRNGTQMLQDGQSINSVIHTGIWVDIFPLINCPKDESTFEVLFENLCELQRLRCKHIVVKHKNPIKACLKALYEFFLTAKENAIRKKIEQLTKEKSEKYLPIGNCYWDSSKISPAKRSVIDKCFFDGNAKYCFENTYKSGVLYPEKYCTKVFGKDYMVPKKYGQHIENYDDVIV